MPHTLPPYLCHDSTRLSLNQPGNTALQQAMLQHPPPTLGYPNQLSAAVQPSQGHHFLSPPPQSPLIMLPPPSFGQYSAQQSHVPPSHGPRTSENVIRSQQMMMPPSQASIGGQSAYGGPPHSLQFNSHHPAHLQPTPTTAGPVSTIAVSPSVHQVNQPLQPLTLSQPVTPYHFPPPGIQQVHQTAPVGSLQQMQYARPPGFLAAQMTASSSVPTTVQVQNHPMLPMSQTVNSTQQNCYTAQRTGLEQNSVSVELPGTNVMQQRVVSSPHSASVMMQQQQSRPVMNYNYSQMMRTPPPLIFPSRTGFQPPLGVMNVNSAGGNGSVLQNNQTSVSGNSMTGDSIRASSIRGQCNQDVFAIGTYHLQQQPTAVSGNNFSSLVQSSANPTTQIMSNRTPELNWHNSKPNTDLVLGSPSTVTFQSPRLMSDIVSPNQVTRVNPSNVNRSQSDEQFDERSSQRHRSLSSERRSSVLSASGSSRADTLSPIDLFDRPHHHDHLQYLSNGPYDKQNDERSFSDDYDLQYTESSSALFPEPPISSERTSLDSETSKRYRNSFDEPQSFTKRSRSDSNGSHDNSASYDSGSNNEVSSNPVNRTARRRLSSLTGGMSVVVAAAGVPCSDAVFNIFKCDFCRATADSAAGMDAHLTSSKHLSGSEFGARAMLGGQTELVYVARTLAVRNGRVSNKSTVIACPVCREVFDDVFVCALHNKYEHSSVATKSGQSSVNTSQDGSGGHYSVCPVIACDTFTLPLDEDASCSDCSTRFTSCEQLFAHWSETPRHMPAASQPENPQIFLLAICLFCQRTFRDDFLGCARHVAAHFDSRSALQRTLKMDVKQVMMPLRHEELPQFDCVANSDGMRDEMLALFRLRDSSQLGVAALKVVSLRIGQLQKLQASHASSLR